MSKFEIIITFFTILYGLMITNLFSSFHKLIRSRKYVKWHWLPLGVSWYLFIVILKNWWGLASIPESTIWLNLFFFIAYGHLLFLIYLVVSAVLPDEVNESGVELKAYYFRKNKYFWLLMTAVIFLSSLIRIIRDQITTGHFVLINLVPIAIFMILTLILALIKRYWVHVVILVVLVIQIVFEIFTV